MIGASINPAPSPSSNVDIKIMLTELELASRIHAMPSGTFTRSIDNLRPNGSVIQPDRQLPIGFPTYKRLPTNPITGVE